MKNLSLGGVILSDFRVWWIGGVKSLFIKEDEETISDRGNQGTIELSKKESQKIETLKKMIIASVDKKTSMTTVAVTLQNPKVAAVVADSVVGKLQEYIINYRTSKAKRRLYLFGETIQRTPARVLCRPEEIC